MTYTPVRGRGFQSNYCYYYYVIVRNGAHQAPYPVATQALSRG